MLKCRDATHQLSEALDRNLSVPERVQLEMHLAMCKGCRNYKKQMSFLRAASRHYAGQLRESDKD